MRMHEYQPLPAVPARILFKGMQPACEICLQNTDEAYSICGCAHKYCLGCCQSHIKACLGSFTSVRCPSEDCGAAFDAHCLPFTSLQAPLKEQYGKLERHRYFLSNPTVKSCKAEDCQGEFRLSSKPVLVCNLCSRAYCEKCLEFKHEGECSQEVHNMMSTLNYRQCRKCLVYVEKIEGCNYISCTCGNQFCYTCGVEWANDPCRLRTFQLANSEIRATLKEIRFKTDCENSNFCLRVVITVYQFLFVPIWIFFGALVLPLILLSLGLFLYAVLSPTMIIALFAMAQEMERWVKNLGIVLTILLYPLVSAILLLLMAVFMVLFVFVRDRFEYHHGVYDPFIEMFLHYVQCFLKVLKSIASA